MLSFEKYGINVPGNATGEVYTSCPECSHTRKKKRGKCLSVNVDKGVWCCHHCGWAGTISKGSKYHDIAWQKPEYLVPKLSPSEAKLIPKVIEYLNGRGISTDVQIRNQLCVKDVYMPQIEKKSMSIGFPYFRDGSVINCKWRDHKKNFRLETGCEQILYGLDDIVDESVVYWVEGEIDKLSVEVAGLKNCVSVPNGAPAVDAKNYISKFDFLDGCQDLLEGKTHVLAFDNDEPGKVLEKEISRRLGRINCKRVRFPDKYKDANEFLIGEGSHALFELLSNAREFPVSGISTAADHHESTLRYRAHGMQAGMSTGITTLDEYMTIRTGEWCVVTGIPNSGKSNLIDEIAVNLMQNKTTPCRVGFFSPENQPIERHVISLAEKLLKINADNMTDDDLDAALRFMHERAFWILPDVDTENWSLDTILNKAEVLVRRNGINILVIDPYNELEHSRPNGLSESEYISQVLSKIRQFCRLHDVFVFLVAHPRKVEKDIKTGNYPVVTPYMISGSANFRNKADLAISVYRDFSLTTNIVQVHVQKVRFKEIGKLGMSEIKYIEEYGGYSQYTH